jgi:heavy metal efflux system protein
VIERLVAFALNQRFITLALALLLTGAGIVSYHRLPIEAYPDVGDVKVEVITLWPGHAAEEVERLITIPLENELNGVANVTFLRSDTLFGLSNIRVLFADGIDSYWARQQAQERITQADLPADAKPALGPLSSVIGEVFRYTLESKTVPLIELKAIQNWVLEREFRKIPGVADVVSWGGGTKQYQVNVDPARLRGYNLTLKQVFDAVAANNSNAGRSYVPQGQYALTVRGIGLFRGPRDIENVVVTAQKGTPVRVRDIGQVGIGHAIRLGVLGRDHDDDLVQGIVLMRKGENPGRVIDALKLALPEIQKLLPAGVELRPYYSRDVLVKRTVATVLRNLVEGAALVMLLLSLFLYNVRAALIVALTIPLSLLFAFVFMDLQGVPSNLLSLGAIDFGIIVDGAVIMAENILRRLSERQPAADRVVGEVQAAAVEVARPLTFAVLIIMTVYVPILTFQRIEGKLFRPMALTISLAVIGSLLLTLTVIPVLSSLVFRRPPSGSETPLLRVLRRPYEAALRWSLGRPLVPVLCAGGGLVVALFVFTILGKEFLPELDEGDLWLRAQFPTGISVEGVRPYTREARERLLRFPEVRVVVSQLGAPDDGTDPEGPDNVEFYVGLRPREEWANSDKDKLIQSMRAALADMPGFTTNFSQPIKDNVDEALAGVKGELAIKLYGPDIFVMDAKAREIVKVLRDVRGVTDLDWDHLAGLPQLQIIVDRASAARYGINVQDIQDVIEAATKGRVVTQLFEGERRFDVAVRLAQDGDPIAGLQNLAISAPNGERIPVTAPWRSISGERTSTSRPPSATSRSSA